MPEVNGTTYDVRTPKEVVNVLERCRLSGRRIRIHYGDSQTGRDWEETYDVCGRVGRSMGPTKIPILVHNSRSLGGGAILDHVIVRIRHSNKKRGGDLYCHPTYHIDSQEEKHV